MHSTIITNKIFLPSIFSILTVSCACNYYFKKMKKTFFGAFVYENQWEWIEPEDKAKIAKCTYTNFHTIRSTWIDAIDSDELILFFNQIVGLIPSIQYTYIKIRLTEKHITAIRAYKKEHDFKKMKVFIENKKLYRQQI